MKNKKIIIFISVITIVSFIIGFSYAYFTTVVVGNDTASSNKTTSGSLRLTYNGNDYISIENAEPGDNEFMTFTVTNSGSFLVNNYDVYISNLSNSFINDEVVYEIQCVSSDAVTCLGKLETVVPKEEGLAIAQGSIAPGTTHTYTLTVEFIESGLEQNYNQEKELTFTMTIGDIIFYDSTLARYDWDQLNFFWEYRENISEVTFEDEINIPVGAYESWDVSQEQNGKIMAYIIDDGLGMDTFELFIQSNNTIYANPYSYYLFYNFNNLSTINNLQLLNTSNAIDMSRMFNDSQSLTSLNLSTFDTSNVTNMAGMFSSCRNLINLNLSSFDTSNVVWMGQPGFSPSGMFENCESLTSLDLSTFNTSSVIYLTYMFMGCNSLITLDLSYFDTSNVTNMSGMFYGCSSLTSLDMSTFDTSGVTSMQSIFGGTVSLTTLYFDNATFISIEDYMSYCMFINSNASMAITVDDPTAYSWLMDRYNNASTDTCACAFTCAV